MLDFFLAIIGVIVVLDGVLSIRLQMKEELYYQIGRGIRIGVGVFLVYYGLAFDVFPLVIDLIALFLVLDGIISVIVQKGDPMWFHIERLFRTGLGVFLYAYSMLVLNPIP